MGINTKKTISLSIYTYATFSASIHMSLNTGCFHILGTVNNGTINMSEPIALLQIVSIFPLDIYSKVGLMNHIVYLLFVNYTETNLEFIFFCQCWKIVINFLLEANYFTIL